MYWVVLVVRKTKKVLVRKFLFNLFDCICFCGKFQISFDVLVCDGIGEFGVAVSGFIDFAYSTFKI